MISNHTKLWLINGVRTTSPCHSFNLYFNPNLDQSQFTLLKPRKNITSVFKTPQTPSLLGSPGSPLISSMVVPWQMRLSLPLHPPSSETLNGLRSFSFLPLLQDSILSLPLLRTISLILYLISSPIQAFLFLPSHFMNSLYMLRISFSLKFPLVSLFIYLISHSDHLDFPPQAG